MPRRPFCSPLVALGLLGGCALPTLSFFVESASPSIIDPQGGSRLVLRGAGFTGASGVLVGGVPVDSFEVVSDGEIHLLTAPAFPAEDLTVEVLRDGRRASLEHALDAWSPAQLPGARLFDAAARVTAEEEATSYEWQVLTRTIAPNWIARDGNTLTWLPSTGKFWMLGGWNGYTPPDGFDYLDPSLGLPPHSTTNEVWSSPDGVTWTQELPDDHPGFDRRHAHSTVLWRDKLWMLGGDWWRQDYNHDVLSSPDGVTWTQELAQTPWKDRALLVAGVFQDQLWMIGGQTLDNTPRDEFEYHNDVWRSEDGIHWEEVLPDEPESETHFSGRGIIGGLAEFQGRLWLVGGGRYRDDFVGDTFFPEVWSSADGATWTQHTPPPWAGRIWHDVVVFDGKLWVLFGYNYSGNLNESWYTEDGETWTQLEPERNIQPGSHAQGVAVAGDTLLYAGGNYSFGIGPTIQDTDKSAWRLKAFHGKAVSAWQDRGADAVTVFASGDERPLLVPDAFGEGVSGVQFDGAKTFLALSQSELQPEGRSVFWVGRAPEMPAPIEWNTPPVLNPLWTVVGGDGAQFCAAGLGEGGIFYTSAHPQQGWVYAEAGTGLLRGPGEVRFAGFSHAADGQLQGWIDGIRAGSPIDGGYSEFHGWTKLGAAGYGPTGANAFAGSLGAVVILPFAADAETVARIHAWSQGRFGAP
jgi:hypothetical protein